MTNTKNWAVHCATHGRYSSDWEHHGQYHHDCPAISKQHCRCYHLFGWHCPWYCFRHWHYFVLLQLYRLPHWHYLVGPERHWQCHCYCLAKSEQYYHGMCPYIAMTHCRTNPEQGFPGPTGTGAPSDRAAYCEQAFVRGNGTFQARYTVACGYSYANLAPARVESQSSWGDCLTDCDDDPRCYGFSYLLTSDEENCFIYNFYPLPAGQPDESFNSGTYVVGSNNGLQRRDI